MGLFDYMIADCPNCNQKIRTQTKAFEWSFCLDDFFPEKDVSEFFDYYDATGDTGYDCVSCGTPLWFEVCHSIFKGYIEKPESAPVSDSNRLKSAMLVKGKWLPRGNT